MANRTPQYRRHHRIYARVKINGQWVHLGKYDDPAAKSRYKQLIAEWAADVPASVPAHEEVSVAEVLEAYRSYAQDYYGDAPSGRYKLMLPTIRVVRELYADLSISDFGPKKLKAVRQKFVDAGYTRGHVNQCVQRVIAIIRWACEEEMVDGAVVHALQAVRPLQRGHTEAPEGKIVTSVPQSVVDATLPFLVPVLSDMVQLQLACGCRPGELCSMTPGQIDRSGDVWLYRPREHKTAHHGHERVVAIGPKGQAILRKYLLRPGDAPCFSPKEALTQYLDQQHERRTTPLSCGHKPVAAKRRRRLAKLHDHYDVAAYRRAIERACDRAFPPPEGLTGKARRQWQHDHRWTPHRLRHTAGTLVREQFGLDCAQAILGHRNVRVTEVYSELNVSRAVEIARKLG